jgi:hypothetical protein
MVAACRFNQSGNFGFFTVDSKSINRNMHEKGTNARLINSPSGPLNIASELVPLMRKVANTILVIAHESRSGVASPPVGSFTATRSARPKLERWDRAAQGSFDPT